jgi:hypothetical protein
MSNQTIPLDYANNLMYELEKAFWDERGKGARFRLTTIGKEYFNDKCLPLIKEPDLDHILKVVLEGVLQGEGIIGKYSYSREDRLLRIRVEGCIHRQVEGKMTAGDIEPVVCVPANLIALSIERKLEHPVELAEIRLEDGVCHLLLIVFEKRPTLA